MKKIKYILTLMLMVFCFILNGELYQSHFQNFTNEFFYIVIDKKDMDDVYSAITYACEEYGVEVFALERNAVTTYRSEITIYATAASKKMLTEGYDILEGEFKSFFSGTTKVEYCDFGEIKDNSSIHIYYFMGEKADVISVRTYINSIIATTYVHKENITGNEKLIYLLWIILFAFILVLTWLDIQFNRKKEFLKLSVGVSPLKLIRDNICMDMLLYCLIFALSYFIISYKIAAFYKHEFIIPGMLITLVIDSLLYLTLLRADYKEVFYGANISEKLLTNTYLLKAIVVITLVFSVACNITMIKDSVEILKPYKLIDTLEGYSTISYTPKDYSQEGYAAMDSKIFLESYLNNLVLLSTAHAYLDEEPVIMLNDIAVNTVVTNPKYFQTESNDMFIVYIPEERIDTFSDEDIRFAVETTSAFLFDINFEEVSYSIVTYPHTNLVYFDLRSESGLEYGFTLLEDPVMVYCNLSEGDINALICDGTTLEFGDYWSTIIFKMSDTSLLSDDVKNGLSSIYFADLIDQCNRYKTGITRKLLLNSVLSISLFMLCVLLIISITRLECMINSREMMLKKICGYSIISRNIVIVMINLFIIFIAFVTNFIIYKMYGIFPLFQLCLVTVCFFVFDTLVFLISMMATEQKNAVNILKGGI